jgi:hypothetical protein
MIEIGDVIPPDTMVIDPDTMGVYMENEAVDIEGYIYMSDEFDPTHGVADIDVGTLVLTGGQSMTFAPEATEIISYYPGLTGDVLKITFDLGDFAGSYHVGLNWDCIVNTYWVDGDFTGGGSFSVGDEFDWCDHRSGDLNVDGEIDISDMVFMVEYMFTNGEAPDPLELADVDANGAVDIADMVYFVEFMFGGGAAPQHP